MKKKQLSDLEYYTAKYVEEHCQQLSGAVYSEIYPVSLGWMDVFLKVSISNNAIYSDIFAFAKKLHPPQVLKQLPV